MNKRTQVKGEKGFFIILAVLSLFLFVVSFKMFLSDPTISGEGTMPALCCLVMLITTALSLLELRGYGTPYEKEIPFLAKGKEVLMFLFPGKVGIIAIYCVLYAAILQLLGFAVSTLIFLVASMLTLNSQKKIRTLVVSIITTVCILVVFQFIFQVQLP